MAEGLLMTDLLLTIKIGINPELGHLGGLLLTWHGIFIALGIGLGVWIGVWFARKAGFTEDDAYTIALIGVPAGIIGARALFVLWAVLVECGQWLHKITPCGVAQNSSNTAVLAR